jgi:hypothetical protein
MSFMTIVKRRRSNLQGTVWIFLRVGAILEPFVHFRHSLLADAARLMSGYHTRNLSEHRKDRVTVELLVANSTRR